MLLEPKREKPILPKGIYIQIYLDAIRGSQKQKLQLIQKNLDRLAALGIKGILWHNATYEPVTKMTLDLFHNLSLECTRRGLLSFAAFGLSDKSPEQAGAHIGLIANLPECFAVVFDMEGFWENEKEDKEKAIRLGKMFREVAPTALAIDQSWPEPTQHWSMFPWEETAEFIDIRAPQFYVNSWMSVYGERRYEMCWPRFLNSWKRLDKRLAPRNLVRPLIFTIQGYKWVLEDQVNCLLSNPIIIIWSDAFPDETTYQALEIIHALKQRGYSGPNAISTFQTDNSLPVTNLLDKTTKSKILIR